MDSLEELIPLLPDELRQNFTFVYESRSPFRKSISPDFPRVILFTKDAKMVLSFTGDPAQSGYDVLEVMAFNELTSRFKFYARMLPAAIRRGESALPLKDCTRCHGKDSRPIYDSYPLWPGFYGSVQDTFPPHLPAMVQEQEKYFHFLGTQANRGVYRHLQYVQGSGVSPFMEPANFQQDKVEGDTRLMHFQPNTRLGMALTELNRKRIFRKLMASSRFRRNEKAYLRELLDCGSSKVGAKLAAKTELAIQAENQARLLRLKVNPADSAQRINDMQELKFIRELAQIDWLARDSQVSRKDWSMALEPNSNSFFDGILSGIYENHSYYLKEDLIFEVLRDLAEREPEFRPYFQVNAVYQSLGYPFGNRIDLKSAVASCALLAKE